MQSITLPLSLISLLSLSFLSHIYLYLRKLCIVIAKRRTSTCSSHVNNQQLFTVHSPLHQRISWKERKIHLQEGSSIETSQNMVVHLNSRENNRGGRKHHNYPPILDSKPLQLKCSLPHSHMTKMSEISIISPNSQLPTNQEKGGQKKPTKNIMIKAINLIHPIPPLPYPLRITKC